METAEEKRPRIFLWETVIDVFVFIVLGAISIFAPWGITSLLKQGKEDLYRYIFMVTFALFPVAISIRWIQRLISGRRLYSVIRIVLTLIPLLAIILVHAYIAYRLIFFEFPSGIRGSCEESTRPHPLPALFIWLTFAACELSYRLRLKSYAIIAAYLVVTLLSMLTLALYLKTVGNIVSATKKMSRGYQSVYDDY